jgi:hypothetical protein
MSISTSSVLVDLNISVWTANKIDRVATDTITDDNSAVRNAAQVRKNLMAGTSARKDIVNYVQACRTWHNTQTLPWSDGGTRLLPTSLFLDYKTEINKRRDTFNSMVDGFLNDYPVLVQQAQQHMGGLFDAADYPSIEEIKSKFNFGLSFNPVPDMGDFRIDIPAEELEAVKANHAADVADRLVEATGTLWQQLHDMLVSMSNKLQDVEDPEEQKKRRYHDSFLDNADTLCDMLAHLNVTNDPVLEGARARMEKAIRGLDIDGIRSDPFYRADAKAKLDDVLKQYEW